MTNTARTIGILSAPGIKNTNGIKTTLATLIDQLTGINSETALQLVTGINFS